MNELIITRHIEWVGFCTASVFGQVSSVHNASRVATGLVELAVEVKVVVVVSSYREMCRAAPEKHGERM